MGKEIATNVKITGTFYDANHKVVDVSYKAGDKLYEFYNIAGILPGSAVPFTIQPVALDTFIVGRTGTSEYQNMINSYSLNVISLEYSMIVP